MKSKRLNILQTKKIVKLQFPTHSKWPIPYFIQNIHVHACAYNIGERICQRTSHHFSNIPKFKNTSIPFKEFARANARSLDRTDRLDVMFDSFVTFTTPYGGGAHLTAKVDDAGFPCSRQRFSLQCTPVYDPLCFLLEPATFSTVLSPDTVYNDAGSRESRGAV